MLGEVLGVERRRRWSDDEKLEILLEVGVGGASVTQVAQRYELTRSQIYGWRRDLRKKGLWSPDRGAVFLPVISAQCPNPHNPLRRLGRSLWNYDLPMVAASVSTAAWMARP